MLNKNDPLIGVVQEVMKKNQAERDATKLVNEYFGITDRKALPHELQGEWNAAYQTVLTEGVESLDEANFPGAPSVKMPRSMAGGKHTKMYGDLHSKLKSLADSGKINTPEGRKEASGHIDAIQNLVDKHLPGNPVPSKKTWLSEDQLEEASLAGLAPPFEKTTRKDVLVGRGVLKKHPTQPGKHVLAKEGSDVTSPSGMGITKPDYATGTPAYAKSKEQTVNRTDKTSLPPGTVAKNIKEEQINERAPRPESMGSQVRGQTTYGTQAMTGMPARSAPADRAGTSAMTGMPARSAPANRVGTSAMTGMPSRSASTRQTSTGAQIGGARPSPSVGGNSGALANAARGQRTSNAIRNLNTPGLRTTNKVNAAGQTKGPNVGLPQKSTVASTGPKASVPTQTKGPNAAMGPKTSAAPVAAAPAAKPAAAAPAAKPAAAKVTPVRKQSSAGAAKPAKRNRLSRTQRDSAVVGPGGRLG